MANALEELQVLSELLQMEKEADLAQFKEKIQRLPLSERKANGYAWYPVQVVKSGYTYGERAVVTVERDVPEDEPHQFRAGKVVNFFTNQPAIKQREKTGVINFVKKNRMQIILNSKDLPDWVSLGQIGVDLLFDDRTYLEMEKALAKVQDAKKGKVAELRNVLLGVQPPRYAPVHQPLVLPQLNDSQNEAVNHILSAQDVAVVHGPPGTGKTTTLVEAVAQLTQQEATVLVTAPSNTAVDLLTERLAEKGWPLPVLAIFRGWTSRSSGKRWTSSWRTTPKAKTSKRSRYKRRKPGAAPASTNGALARRNAWSATACTKKPASCPLGPGNWKTA